MSGPDPRHAPDDPDRRLRKTRAAILGAFESLVHGRRRRYAEIRVGDIVQDADVGRSTFYEHYKSKDDMLLASMSDMLDVLAGAVTDRPDLAHIERMLDHFADMRTFAREVLWGPQSQHVAPRIARTLAARIAAHLQAMQSVRSVRPLLPLSLIAAQIAEAELGLVRAWLSADSDTKPADVALAMHTSARAAALALLG